MIRLFNRYWALPAAVSLTAEGLLLFAAVPLAIQLRLGVGPGMLPPRSTILTDALTFTIIGLSHG